MIIWPNDYYQYGLTLVVHILAGKCHNIIANYISYLLAFIH